MKKPFCRKILLTYFENQSSTNKETEVEIVTTPIVEVPECSADILTSTPREDDEISEKSQKARVEDITVTSSTSQPIVKSDEILI